MSTNYQKLTQKLEEISRLGGIMGILHWDQEVIMPSGAAESRAKQMGALAGIIHEKSTDPEIGSLLEKISQENSFNTFENYYKEYGILIVLGAGFTPFPFKFITIASGVFSLNIFLFILTAFIARGLRFYLLASLLFIFGEKIKILIDKYFNILAVLFFILLIGSFMLIKLF